jgi:hypothetical protein
VAWVVALGFLAPARPPSPPCRALLPPDLRGTQHTSEMSQSNQSTGRSPRRSHSQGSSFRSPCRVGLLLDLLLHLWVVPRQVHHRHARLTGPWHIHTTASADEFPAIQAAILHLCAPTGPALGLAA